MGCEWSEKRERERSHQCAGLVWAGSGALAPPCAAAWELKLLLGTSGLRTEMHFQLSR